MPIVAMREGAKLRWLGVVEGPIRIGRPHYCPIALMGDAVTRMHASLEPVGEGLVIRDLGSTNGTFVNDVLIRTPTAIQPTDLVRIGPFTVTFAIGWEPVGDEEAFLAAILADPSDDDTRVVYGDWLEEHGETKKAAFLRDEKQSASDGWWRAVVAHTKIDECKRAGCPGRWSALRGGIGARRECGACGRMVRYCTGTNELRAAGAAGEPIALDVECEQYRSDYLADYRSSLPR